MTVFVNNKVLADVNKHSPNSPMVVLPATYLESQLKLACNDQPGGIPAFCYYSHYNFRNNKVQLFRDTDEQGKETKRFNLGYAFPIHTFRQDEQKTFMDCLEQTLEWFACNVATAHAGIVRKKVPDRNFVGFYFRPLNRVLIQFLIPDSNDDPDIVEYSFADCIRKSQRHDLVFDTFSQEFLNFLEINGLY